MAHLVKQKKTYYAGPDGKRYGKDAAGAKKVTEESSKWYAAGVPGWPKGKRVPLATRKDVAERMLSDLVRRAERGVTDIPATDLHRAALSDLIDEFKGDVELGLASKTRTRRKPDPKQVALVVQRVRDVLGPCGFRTVADLNDAPPQKWARHRNAGVGVEWKNGGLSHQSAAFVLAAVKRFVRWLSANRRAPVRAELFDLVPGFDPKNERVHARRKADPEQLATILDAALNSTRPFKRMGGADRYMLYLTAFSTGFRAAELASLTPENFDLTADPPAVVLSGKVAKNKKVARQPLPPAVAVQLARHLAGKPAGERVWPGAWHRHGARMLRGDLKVAGIPYAAEVNGEKRFLDFHALRASFISALAEAGIGPKELQELARHSDPRLTLGVYTHVTPKQLAGAVVKLPLPGQPASPSPFAHLTREQVEAALAVALTTLGGILPNLVTPPVTPAGGPAGNILGRVGTIPLRGSVLFDVA